MSEQFNPGLACTQSGHSVLAIFLLAGASYALASAVSMMILNFAAPVSSYELSVSSWRVNAPCMTHLALFLGLICAVMSATWMSHGRVIGIPALALSFILFGIGMPETAFRAAVLEGDAKIGCYDYNSRACLSMLGLPTRGATIMRSIEVTTGPQWPIEVLAVLHAPLDLFDLQRLNLTLDA